MKRYFLRMCLLSDTTFGRGDGVAGLVDAEVEHDEYGLPFLRGRALKGLLAEECANVLYALGQQKLSAAELEIWKQTAERLFGRPGSTLEDDALMRVGDALLPQDLRDAVRVAVESDKDSDKESIRLDPSEILSSLTAYRRQTRMTVKGAPQKDTLRSMRVVLRETVFDADLCFDSETGEGEQSKLALLAACAASLRRVGLGRNRGRGKVVVKLYRRAQADSASEGEDITAECLQEFSKALPKEAQ